MKLYKTIASAIFTVFCLFSLFTTAEAKEQLQIITTIFPEYDWVMNILGENPANAEVTQLMDNGVDLHSYQPTADDMLKLANCDLFIYVGGESDEWVHEALSETGKKGMVIINLLKVLGDAVKEEELIEGMQETEHEHDHKTDEDDHEHEHEHEETEYEENYKSGPVQVFSPHFSIIAVFVVIFYELIRYLFRRGSPLWLKTESPGTEQSAYKYLVRIMRIDRKAVVGQKMNNMAFTETNAPACLLHGTHETCREMCNAVQMAAHAMK